MMSADLEADPKSSFSIEQQIATQWSRPERSEQFDNAKDRREQAV